MPLEILLVLVVGGITAIGVALHFLGFSKARPMTREKAEQQWQRHFEGARITQVVMAKSGRACLVRDEGGLGVMWQFGADTVARRLPCRRVDDHAHGLRLRFADFTAPVVLLKLDADEREQWKTEMERA